MKKKLLVLFVVLLLAFTLCACSNEEANAPEVSEKQPATSDLILPTIEDDYWDVFDLNCDIVYDLNFVSSIGVDFTLLSAVPLEENDVVVTADKTWRINYSIDPYDMEEGKCTMYESIFLLYQGVTPDELASFQADDLSIDRRTEIYNLIQAFRALDENEKPTIYRYSLNVVPILATETDYSPSLNEITVNVKGESRTYKLGRIMYAPETAGAIANDPDFHLNCDDNLGFFGHNVEVSNDGRNLLYNIKFNAVDDVTLTGLSFYNGKNIKIESVSVTQTSDDGAAIDTTWDITKPFKLSAGDSIVLNVKIYDPFFAGTLGGWDTIYLLLDYSYKGETYELGVPHYCVQRLDDPFAYIAMEDGIDILSYYTDYRNRNSAY